jgi:hypothetical protein
MKQPTRFALPWTSKADLARRADLYRRLAAAMRDRVKAQALADLARKYEAVAEAAED